MSQLISLMMICGLQGTLAERILDCAKYSEHKVSGFELVMQAESGERFYQSKQSGLIWASVTTEDLNHRDGVRFCQTQFENALPGVQFSLPRFKQMSRELSLRNLPDANRWVWALDEVLPDEFYIYNPTFRDSSQADADPTASTVGWISWGVRCAGIVR